MARQFILAVLGTTLAMCAAVIALNAWVDPFQQYRKAERFPARFYNAWQRYENPGIAKHYDYDRIVTGLLAHGMRHPRRRGPGLRRQDDQPVDLGGDGARRGATPGHRAAHRQAQAHHHEHRLQRVLRRARPQRVRRAVPVLHVRRLALERPALPAGRRHDAQVPRDDPGACTGRATTRIRHACGTGWTATSSSPPRRCRASIPRTSMRAFASRSARSPACRRASTPTWRP